MSLPALLVLLVMCSLALLAEFLLWHALRRENWPLLHRISGLILLAFGLMLLFVLFTLLEKPLSQASWPWSWIGSGLSWCLELGAFAPLVWVGIDLVWKVAPAAPSERIEWDWLLTGSAVGCLVGVIAGFHWFGGWSAWPVAISAQGSAPTLFGGFSLDGFLEAFLWGVMFCLPRAYLPRMIWWVRSFSERRWFAIGTTLLLLSLVSIAWLI